MPQPINYMAAMPQTNPLQSLLTGLKAGTALGDVATASRAREQAAKMQEEYRTDLQNAFQNPTPEAMAMLTAKYPQQREAFKQSWDMMSEGQKNNRFSQGVQVYSALQNGDTDTAKNILNKNISALEAKGEDTTDFKNILQGIDANPTMTTGTIGLYLSSVDPDRWKKVQESVKTEKTMPLDIAKIAADLGLTKAQTAKTVADAKKTNAEIRKTNLESEKVTAETVKLYNDLKKKSPIKLSAGSEKLLNDSVIASENARSLSTQYNNLADTIDSALKESETGVAGRGAEAIKKFWGNQDQVTATKQAYMKLKNSAVLNMLPPGAASDKDIEIAMAAFPDENSSPELISSFMRGMAKLQNYDMVLNENKAGWISQNGNLGPANNDITVNGEKVDAGTSFNDYIKTKIKDTTNVQPEQSQEQIQYQEGQTATNPTTGEKMIFRNGNWEAL